MPHYFHLTLNIFLGEEYGKHSNTVAASLHVIGLKETKARFAVGSLNEMWTLSY